MAKIIYGIGRCARVLGIGKERIKRLIYIKKINPKKEGKNPTAPYIFTPEDQEIIQCYTSIKH